MNELTLTREEARRPTRAEFVAAARGWMGTPWYPAARVKGLGCDCGGLLVGVMHELGMTDWEPPAFEFDELPERLREALLRFCDAVPGGVAAGLQPADVVVFRYHDHDIDCALVTEAGTVVHSWEPAGRVCEHAIDPFMASRIAAVYRFRGLAP